MSRLKIVALGLFLLMLAFILNGKGEKQKIVEAIRIDEPITIDGLLTEKIWQTKGYTGFTQFEPDDGALATQETVVRVAYDNESLYISARLFDSDPGSIVGLLGRRDDFVDSDWFIISIDPYLDRRSGFEFAVNPKGSISDWTIFNDEQKDATWDGVWESKANIDKDGWTVEAKIPFNQLRFKKKNNEWGINFRRIIRRKNEEDSFVLIPRLDSGYVSHFAKLVGIEKVKTHRPIEIMPFAAGKTAFSPEVEGSPFETGNEWASNAGLDLKIGLKSNLTLNLTVNPDFGQVEVDPAVINLSAAETYYSEKRPFFIEGADIFRFGGSGSNRYVGAAWDDPKFFYSRRIGRAPQGLVTSPGYTSYPEWATILSAAKITGKVGKGWNVGFLSALTSREFAQIDLEGQRSKEEVEPFTSYGVLRVLKEFKEGQQGLGFIATSLFRNLRTDNLKSFLNKNALSFATDGWVYLDNSKTWVFTSWFGATWVSGSNEDIWTLQNSYPHYFQRPDASHLKLDRNATSMSGWASRMTINKQKGPFLFNAALGAVSPGFHSSDIGFLRSADLINGHVMIGYETFKPGKIFRRWDIHLYTQRNYDFGWNRIGEQRLIFITHPQFLNYWGGYFQVSYNPAKWSKDLARGGPLIRIPSETWGDISFSSDSRKKIVWSLYSYLKSSVSGSWLWNGSIGARIKTSKNFNLTLSPDYTYKNDVAQWVTSKTDVNMTSTYGKRYIFGSIIQKTLSCVIRMNWTFTPKLSLQAYLQPYISVGYYSDFKELAKPKTFSFNRYSEGESTIYLDSSNGYYIVDPDGSGPSPVLSFKNPDFNYKSLRSTVVFRWEYLPGSTLYVVWTQNRADYSYPGDFSLGRDFGNLLSAPGDNIFMIKLTYLFKM